MVKFIVDEILGFVVKVLYGYRVIRMYRKLLRRGERDGVVASVARDGVMLFCKVCYDEGERCVMDIYVLDGLVVGVNVLVLFFVYGGVWASGEVW